MSDEELSGEEEDTLVCHLNIENPGARSELWDVPNGKKIGKTLGPMEMVEVLEEDDEMEWYLMLGSS